MARPPAARVPRTLLTVDEAAESFGVSVPLIYRLINEGALESVRIGSRRFTSPAMLEACVEKLRAQGAPSPREVPNTRRDGVAAKSRELRA